MFESAIQMPCRTRFSGSARGGHHNRRFTTQAIIKSQARKKRNRKLRVLADQAEADKLGITVEELRRQRYLSALPLLRVQLTKVFVPVGTFRPRPETKPWYEYYRE